MKESVSTSSSFPMFGELPGNMVRLILSRRDETELKELSKFNKKLSNTFHFAADKFCKGLSIISKVTSGMPRIVRAQYLGVFLKSDRNLFKREVQGKVLDYTARKIGNGYAQSRRDGILSKMDKEARQLFEDFNVLRDFGKYHSSDCYAGERLGEFRAKFKKVMFHFLKDKYKLKNENEMEARIFKPVGEDAVYGEDLAMVYVRLYSRFLLGRDLGSRVVTEAKIFKDGDEYKVFSPDVDADRRECNPEYHLYNLLSALWNNNPKAENIYVNDFPVALKYYTIDIDITIFAPAYKRLYQLVNRNPQAHMRTSGINFSDPGPIAQLDLTPFPKAVKGPALSYRRKRYFERIAPSGLKAIALVSAISHFLSRLAKLVLSRYSLNQTLSANTISLISALPVTALLLFFCKEFRSDIFNLLRTIYCSFSKS